MDIKHARGALSEMIAAAQLIKQGWHVFHNLSSNGLIDLVVVNPETGETRFYDVKTKSYRKDGTLINRIAKPHQKKIGVEIYMVDRVNMEELNEHSDS
tara:strand:- start:336 stop:629 length:294 start_codon:yes stop_codon:yes gene_type:complete